MAIRVSWRGDFTSTELNALHAAAFGTRRFSDEECDWHSLVASHSLGWVVARDGETLAGFVNVVWDGLVHAWLQDTIVSPDYGRLGIGTRLVAAARAGAAAAGCEWLHVDFDEQLRPFYVDSCGFTPSAAGVLRLRPTDGQRTSA